MEEVGHTPHSSLWRQGVWIGTLCNTGRGVTHIFSLITEERQAVGRGEESEGERQEGLRLDL